MSASPVTIEVTRGSVVESRHVGAAVVVRADGSIVESWGDVDAGVLPRSAIKPLQAMPFVESGAVERFGLDNRHIAISCASHNGEMRHVDLVREWLARIGLSENDLECGPQPPKLMSGVEALAREGKPWTNAFNNCSGKHSGFLSTAVQHGEPTRGYIGYDHPVQRRIRDVMGELGGLDMSRIPWGVDGCGIPTLAVPLTALARMMAQMADPSRLSNRRAEAAGRIRAAMNAEPFMVAGTGRFCTTVNGLLVGVAQVKTGAEGMFCGILPRLGYGVALKMDDGAGRAAEVAMAAILSHLGVLPAAEREAMTHPAVKNVVGLLVGEVRPARTWLG